MARPRKSIEQKSNEHKEDAKPVHISGAVKLEKDGGIKFVETPLLIEKLLSLGWERA